MKKLGVCFLVAMLMVSFALGSVSTNAYAVTTKKIGIGNLTEDDLVAAWYFDEDSGDVVKDYKGNYDGTANGTTMIDTPYGKGIRIDSVDDYIEFGKAIIPIGKKSVRFKFKAGDVKSSYSSIQTILSNTNLSAEGSYGTEIGLYNGRVFLNIRNSKNTKIIDVITKESFADNQWHDVLLTWDGTIKENGFKIYIDDLNNAEKTGTATSCETQQPSNNLRIGKQWNEFENYRPFKGELSQIEIYNEVYMPPSAPTNLIATAGDKKVKLSWEAVKGADSYTVMRSTTEGESYRTIKEGLEETNYIDDIDIKNGTTYYYVVIAIIDGEESPKSNEASATPEGDSSSGSGDNALLRITMSNGKINEYDLSMSDVEDFIDWYEDKADDKGKPYYVIEKNYNIGPFESRKDYITFDKILQFEVMEYNK